MDALKKLFDLGYHALTGLNLLQSDSPEVEPAREAVVGAMRRGRAAQARLEERCQEDDEARAEQTRCRQRVRLFAAAAPDLLVYADASLRNELQSSDALAKADPVVVTEALIRTAHGSSNKHAKAIGNLLHRALSDNAAAMEKAEETGAARGKAERELALASAAITGAANQAVALIRASADEHSPALKHVKRRYHRKSVPSPAPTTVPAQPVATPQLATPTSTEPVVVPLPVTAANEPANAKAETDPKAA